MEDNISKLNRKTLVRSLITLVVLVALYLLIRRLSGVLLPFLLSFVVAYMLAPIVNFFQHTCRFKSRVLSVLVTIISVVGILTGAIAAIVPLISRQAKALSVSVKNYLSQYQDIEFLSPELNEQLKQIIQNMDINALLQSEGVQQGAQKLMQFLGEGLWAIGNSIMGLAVAFISLLYIIFLLIDYEKITLNWHKYIPEKFRASIQMLLSDLDRNMNAYFRGQALVAGIVGILFAIGFQIIGLPMGIGIGLMIGVLNLVPYMQVLGIPPCIILGLIHAAETGRPAWVILLFIAIVFVVVQVIQDGIIVPKIMGDVTGMGPAWILLSLSIWGSLLGVIGMVVALPLTTLLVSYYKRFVLELPEEPKQKSTQTSWWKKITKSFVHTK
jgi:predicted PurR-regulated permease PerM